MPDEVTNTKIKLLVEEYKTVSGELRLYVQETFRCIMYAAILVALFLGWGSDKVNNISEYMPFGFVLLVIYYLSIYYVSTCLSRYRADLEENINKFVDHDNLLGLDSFYNPRTRSKGRLNLGDNDHYNFWPTPLVLLLIILAASIVIVFVEKEMLNEKYFIMILLGLCCLIGFYIFYKTPKLIEEHILPDKKIPNNAEN